MAYKALYRKYRPSSFDEVVGQQHIVMTLQNAIKNNKLAHAYLFCGPRGTGKTSIAKILAKTINCQSEGAKPCCKCSSCLDIQESTHPDVIELDAASNNGVEEVREIIDKVKYAPMNGKFKVYIIDEVHMMTSSAFNALLKTLEEPPEYCIFVLATTEPHKVLPTIISRCQRFDFKKIAKPVLKGNINRVCDKEGIRIDDAAVDLIASLAEGGMRDALSILDQVVAYAQNDIKLQDVSDVYGVATLAEKLSLLECVKNKDSKALIDKTKKISSNGIDITRLVIDLIDICKEAVVYSYSKKTDILEIMSVNEVEGLLSMFSTNQLLQYIDYLIDTQSKFREATNSLTYLEVCLLKMMDYSGSPVVSAKIETEPVKSAINRQPVKEEKKVEQKIQEEQEEKNIISYSDDVIYNILTSANKMYKENDNKFLYNLPINEFNDKEKALYNVIKQTPIFASSADSIIFATATRENATQINEFKNNQMIHEMLKRYLPNEKRIIAVTNEESEYLITLFKTKQSQKAAVKEEIKEEKEDLVDEKMTALFGQGGYDVVEG